MAALGQENGARIRPAGPQAADESVGHPVRADMLRVIDFPELSERRRQLLDAPEIRMETHLEAQRYRHALSLRSRQQGTVGGLGRGRRLLQQHRPPTLDALQRQRHMQPVRRRDDDRVYRSLDCARDDRSKEGIRRGKAAVGGNAEARGGLAEPEGIRFHQAAYVHPLRQAAEVFPGAVSRSYDGDIHILTSGRGREEGRPGWGRLR